MRRVRKGRSAWVGIVVVVAFFVGVTLAFAWIGKAGPDIPHSVGGDRATCITCHPTAGLPDSHRDRVNGSCRACHAERSSDASGRSGGPEPVESAGNGSFQAADFVAAARA